MYENFRYSVLKPAALLILFFSILYYTGAQNLMQPAPEISISAELQSEEKNSAAVIRIFYSFPENFHQTLNKDFFKAEITVPENISYETEYPEGKAEEGIINYYGNAELLLKADLSDLDPGTHSLTVEASWQLCDENGTCYFPGTKKITADIVIPGSAGKDTAGKISDSLPLSKTEEDITGSNNLSGINKAGSGSQLSAADIIKYLLLAFTGGLLLNIMPCVFPLLSIKALSLVQQSRNNKKEILISSLFYSAGIIISLTVLAVFLIIIKQAGQFAGWGFQMQNKWFVLFLISIIYLFALSMFDVFTITVPGVNTAGKLSAKKGYTGHFLTGIFAVLVAAPCTAPFLGSAIAFSLSGSSVLILLSFLFIGAGFAFPFLLLGFNPSIVKMLPKPGKWSVYFKEILGFVLAGTSFYLLISFAQGKPSSVIASIIIFLFVITFFAWIYGKISLSGIKRKYSVSILFLLIILSIYSAVKIPDLNYETGNTAAESSEGTESFSEEKVDYFLDNGYSVFVDIYADWCTTCKINDRLVINTDEVKKLFKENRTVLLKGDFTDNNQQIAEWMNKNGKAGVPVYVFYKDKTSSPVFLPELLTKKKISELFNQ